MIIFIICERRNEDEWFGKLVTIKVQLGYWKLYMEVTVTTENEAWGGGSTANKALTGLEA